MLFWILPQPSHFLEFLKMSESQRRNVCENPM